MIINIYYYNFVANFDSPPPSSSDSDSDDSNLDEACKSAIFIQKKVKSKNESDQSASSSRAETPTAHLDQSGSKLDAKSLKRKANLELSSSSKKMKSTNDLNVSTDGITEEAVRRYLMRKPMTAADLLQKFKNKVSAKDDLVRTIALILRRLNPEKQTIKNKLYFSLKPS